MILIFHHFSRVAAWKTLCFYVLFELKKIICIFMVFKGLILLKYSLYRDTNILHGKEIYMYKEMYIIASRSSQYIRPLNAQLDL